MFVIKIEVVDVIEVDDLVVDLFWVEGFLNFVDVLLFDLFMVIWY